MEVGGGAEYGVVAACDEAAVEVGGVEAVEGVDGAGGGEPLVVLVGGELDPAAVCPLECGACGAEFGGGEAGGVVVACACGCGVEQHEVACAHDLCCGGVGDECADDVHAGATVGDDVGPGDDAAELVAAAVCGGGDGEAGDGLDKFAVCHAVMVLDGCGTVAGLGRVSLGGPPWAFWMVSCTLWRSFRLLFRR